MAEATLGSVSLSPTGKKKHLDYISCNPFNANYPQNPYKTCFRRDADGTLNMHVYDSRRPLIPAGKEDSGAARYRHLNMNMSLEEYRLLDDGGKLAVHDARIRAMRQRWCPVSMVNPDGTIHYQYFDSKPMAMEWTDLEKAVLFKGIWKHGLATMDAWKAIIRDWLPQRTPIEIKLEISRLVGRQCLDMYKDVKFTNELQIAREYKKNRKLGKQCGKWLYGVYMDLMTDDMMADAKKKESQAKAERKRLRKLRKAKRKNKDKNGNADKSVRFEDETEDQENANGKSKNTGNQRTLDGQIVDLDAIPKKSKSKAGSKNKAKNASKKDAKKQTTIAVDKDNSSNNKNGDNSKNSKESKNSKKKKRKSKGGDNGKNQPKINLLMQQMAIGTPLKPKASNAKDNGNECKESETSDKTVKTVKVADKQDAESDDDIELVD